MLRLIILKVRAFFMFYEQECNTDKSAHVCEDKWT
jgi:hypothetical protein